MGKGALEEGRLGAEPDRLRDRHPRVDPVAAGAVRRGLHHAPLVPPAAHHQELDVPELGVVLTAHFDEERVEIDVQDASAHDGLGGGSGRGLS